MRRAGQEARLGQLKYWWRAKRPEVVSGLLYRFVRGVGATLRVSASGFEESDESVIYCGWHGRSLVFADFFRNRGYWVIISHSRDGDMQNQIFRRLGYQVIRGSTGRGGARAAIEAIKALRDGGTMAITPDGPRGPSGIVQGGVMLMAQKSGARLVPVGISARPRKLVRSWDRYLLPVPFARAVLIAGRPLTVPRDAGPAEVERIRLQLQNECHRLQDAAERSLGIKSHSAPACEGEARIEGEPGDGTSG